MTYKEMKKIFDATLAKFKADYPEFDSKIMMSDYIRLSNDGRLDVMCGATVSAECRVGKNCQSSVDAHVDIPFHYDKEKHDALYSGASIEEPIIDTYREHYSYDDFMKASRQMELIRAFIKTYFESALQKDVFNQQEDKETCSGTQKNS